MIQNRKVLLITNIPTPYRIPLFNVLHEELARSGVAFKVVFGALGYARRQWKVELKDCTFPFDILSTLNLRFSDPEKSSFTYGGLFRVIKREQPDVIITNAFSIATTKLWMRSFLHQTRYVIWSGAIQYPGLNMNSLRRWQRKLLVRRARGFVAYGTRAQDYLVAQGAPRDRVNIGINTVDTTFFSRETERLKRSQPSRDDRKTILFVGHLVPRKGVDRLLKVVQLLAASRQDFILEIVGAGDDRPNLEWLASDLGVCQYVKFLGFRQKDDIPLHMSRASCFVFPTNHDIWGLVLVEAMAAGLPCISSNSAGATCDLIHDGRTGFAVDFCDTELVAARINWLLDHPEQSELMGQRAKKLIDETVTLNESAKGFVAAIERALT